MPVDYDDLETDSADGEKKVIEGESFVDLDFKSNIMPAEDLYRKDKMLSDKNEEELGSLMSKISLTDESGDSEEQDEIISRAPIGGIPVTFTQINRGLKNGSAAYNFGNSYPFDSKPKRSFAESELHATKYKKPTDNVLQTQCNTMHKFLDQNVMNTQASSGGTVTINSSSSVDSEEYDSSFSPGESNYDYSPPGDVQVESPSSDYSSMASPDNFDPFLLEASLNLDSVKKDSVFNDLIEIIQNDCLTEEKVRHEKVRLEKVRLEKVRLEKVLSEDHYVASSPPQYVPGQGSTPSSSPPPLYDAELDDILEGVLNAQDAQSPQAQPQTYLQTQQLSGVNSNHQYTQQQPPLVTSPGNLQYNAQLQQTNGLNQAPTHQHYPAPPSISTNGNQYVNSPPQPQILSSSLLGYTQQNHVVPFASNQRLISQQPVLNSNQYPVARQSVPSSQPHFPQAQEAQYTVQPQSQIVTTTSNQQPFTLSQHQSIATPKQEYISSPPQQHVTATQGQCVIQPMQAAIPAVPSSTSMASPQNSGLTHTGVADQNGLIAPSTTIPAMPAPATSPNNAVIILTQSPNSQNPIMLVPTTSSPLVYMSQIPKTPVKAIRPERKILPKPANADTNSNLVDLKKLPSQTGKGRRDKDKLLQQCETPGQGNLGVARRCLAAIKDEHLEIISDKGDNYLHVAVCRTDVYMIEALLERLHRIRKLDLIDKQNNARQTPVYLAVSANQPAMVHKLIRYGADVNVKGVTHERVERAPIHCAASQGKEYYDTLKELFKSEKIDPDILNSDGLSALHCAIIEHGKLNQNLTKIDNCQNVALLLKHKANPNLPDKRNGKTPLMYALETKDYAMIETILKGVESSKISELLTTKTFDGRTCAKIADGLRNEYDPQTWRKINNFLSNAH